MRGAVLIACATARLSARRPRGTCATCRRALRRRATHQVLKYKTDQLQDLKRLEKLNNLMFTLMALGEVPPEDELAASGAVGSAGGGGKDDAVAAAPAKKKGRRQ